VLANPSKEFSGSLGNVAWKERVDGWKMKDKGAIPMTNGTSIAPSEGRGVGDIDASTDYNMEDALLYVLTFSCILFISFECSNS
jgi:cellulose synthase A